MRRLMSMLLAVGFLGTLVGCHGARSHGICDCDDDCYCASRAPWTRYAPSATPHNGVLPSEPIPVAPMKLPDGKKL